MKETSAKNYYLSEFSSDIAITLSGDIASSRTSKLNIRLLLILQNLLEIGNGDLVFVEHTVLEIQFTVFVAEQLIKNKHNINHIFSDGYDLVHEGVAFLCEHYGEHIHDVIGINKKGKQVTRLIFRR